jgi:two-component system chemotaxis response regulator CheY
MIVDDSSIMRRLLINSLKKGDLADFTFVEARDGPEALRKLKDDDVDDVQVIFIDWDMPTMSGVDLVRAIRKAGGRHTPVVMLARESTMATVEAALEDMGVECFIAKPFTVEIVRKKLELLLPKLASASRSAARSFLGKLVAKLT